MTGTGRGRLKNYGKNIVIILNKTLEQDFHGRDKIWIQRMDELVETNYSFHVRVQFSGDDSFR